MTQKAWTLEELLTTAPLYHGADVELTGPGNLTPALSLPSKIRMYCKQCDHETTWNNTAKDKRLLSIMLHLTQYECANCTVNPSMTTFALYPRVTQGTRTVHGGPLGASDVTVVSGRIIKFGQYPPPQDRISKQLAKRLGDEHTTYYETAIRLRNFGAGIGSLAYLRRIVEDTANQLVDIVLDEAKAAGDQVDFAEEVSRIKASHDVGAKIELAKRVLPQRLVIGGNNPLDKLHQLASAVLHGGSDEQGVSFFDECRIVFDFFFEELPARHERESKFRIAASKPLPPIGG